MAAQALAISSTTLTVDSPTSKISLPPLNLTNSSLNKSFNENRTSPNLKSGQPLSSASPVNKSQYLSDPMTSSPLSSASSPSSFGEFLFPFPQIHPPLMVPSRLILNAQAGNLVLHHLHRPARQPPQRRIRQLLALRLYHLTHYRLPMSQTPKRSHLLII
jgi:hypothetical protein